MPHCDSYTDRELMASLKNGDAAAFTEIHKRYYGVLYRHAYKQLANREEIKDILQELFTYLWNNRTAMNLDHSLPAYLYTSVRNKLLNIYKHYRIKDHYVSSLQDFIENNQPETDESIRTKQLIDIVEAEVARLPSQMRTVFEMSRKDHLSHQEIAGELNISVLTVRKQVNNSLRVLRLRLGTYLI